MEVSRAKKLDIIPVSDLNSRRTEILKKARKNLSLSTFDPRQPDHQRVSNEAVEKLQCDLLKLNQLCAFLNVLVPSVEKIRHDHMYAKPPKNEVMNGIAEKLASSHHSDTKLSLVISLEGWAMIEKE